jgi:hypothetical protein
MGLSRLLFEMQLKVGVYQKLRGVEMSENSHAFQPKP